MQLRGSALSLAAVCLAAASLAGNAYTLYDVTRQPADVPVRVYAVRFDDVRPYLPPNGVIGYVSDLQEGSDTEQAGLYFYLTQYFLTPRILEEGAAHAYVIGDYQAQVPPPERYADLNLQPRFVGDDGVVLYVRDVR